MLVSLILLLPKFSKNGDVTYEKIFETIMLTVLLFAPHFIESIVVTKSFLGILRRSGDAAGREYLGKGLIDYITWLPNDMGGWLLGIVSIIGILAVGVVISKKKWRQEHVGLIWVGCIGLSVFILNGAFCGNWGCWHVFIITKY